MNADEFLREYEGVPGRWELWDGEPRLMSGGSVRHGLIALDIASALRTKLRGSGCLPGTSDIGLRLDDGTLFYPDAAIYCDPRDTRRDLLESKSGSFPCVIFEVLSPSVHRFDRSQKVERYREIESVRLVVLVDPVTRTLETYERIDPTSWRVTRHPEGAALELAHPAITLTAEEVFAGD